MSTNSTGTSTTMSSSTPSTKNTKRVAKKTEVAVVIQVPVVVQEAKPVIVEKPVAAAAPEAQAVASATSNLPTTTVAEDIQALVVQVQSVRDSSVNMLRTLQKLQKRVAREIKEAGRRRRRHRVEGDETREKRPTIFTTPVTLKNELCGFLGKPNGFMMTPADVTRALSAYVESHKLKDAEKGHTIHPDASMRKVLGIKDGDVLTYRNIQSYLYKLYNLPERKKAAVASQ